MISQGILDIKAAQHGLGNYLFINPGYEEVYPLARTLKDKIKGKLIKCQELSKLTYRYKARLLGLRLVTSYLLDSAVHLQDNTKDAVVLATLEIHLLSDTY